MRHPVRSSPVVGVARAVGALATLVVLLIGVPVGLWVVGGSPLPTGAFSVTAIGGSLTRPDDGALLLGVLRVAGWLGWASFAVAVTAEAWARARGVTPPQLPGLGVQQRLAAGLVAAAVLAVGPVTAQASTLPGHSRPSQASGPAVAGGEPATAPTIPVRTVVPSTAAPSGSALPTNPGAGGSAATSGAGRPVATGLVVVGDGDTLWRLAEAQLGDGMRWRELAQTNYGRAQPDGRSLDATHVLQPGWTLALPSSTPATSAAPASPMARSHMVVAGDTLSGIALQELGDAQRYPELATAAAGVVQPDGRRLTDPDVIQPGWTVPIPDARGTAAPAVDAAPLAPAVDAAPPAPAVDAAPEALVAPVVPVVPVAPVEPTPVATEPAPPPVTPEAAVPDVTAGLSPGVLAPADEAISTDEATSTDQAADTDEAPSPIRTVTGIGALLAAGILAALAVRRGRQRAHRHPGMRLPLPVDPRSQRAEEQLRQVAAVAPPAALAAALMDLSVACRASGRDLPRVRAARLTPDSVELYLTTAASLPQPWVALDGDPTTWSRSLPAGYPRVADGVRPPDIDPLAGDAAPAELAGFPFPTLVTLGHDTPTSHLLVDLDELGVLAVDGPVADSRDTVTALAAELATNLWSGDVLVSVIGAPAGLAEALPTGRLRVSTPEQVVAELAASAPVTRHALREAGASSLAAARHRTQRYEVDAEDWEYAVVLAMSPIPDHIERELTALATSGIGVSLVLCHDTRAALPTSPLEEKAMWILEHRAPDHDPRDRHSVDAQPAQQRAILHPVGVPLVPQTLGVDALHAVLDAVRHSRRPSSPSRWTPPEPVAPQSHRPAPADPDPVPAAAVHMAAEVAAPEASLAAALHTPRLRLLGPVLIDGATGPAPGTHTARTVALLVILAVHRDGRTREQLADALSPNHRLADATVHALISRARRWLGADQTGSGYLPRAVSGGSAVYRLTTEVGTDWDTWRELVGPNPARTPTGRLVEALALVRDTPFAGVVERHYAWAEPLREEMVASIVDVAHEVATRSLHLGDLAVARRAVQAGRRADPGAEVLWRDALLVESAAGAHGTVATLVSHIQSWADDSGLDLDPATEALVLALDGNSAPGRRLVPEGATAERGRR